MLSPDLLAANINALTAAQGFCPTLAGLREGVKVVSVAPLQVQLETTAGAWEPVDFDCPADAAAWLAESPGPEATQIIVAAAGLGYALDAAVAGGATHVLAIEPDAGLATLLLSRRDWSEWFASGRLRLLTGPDYRGAADVARFLDGLSDVKVIGHPLRARTEPREVAAAVAVGERVARNVRANGEARRKFAGPYLLQTLANLPAIARSPGVEALDAAFTSTPAILCGAGPSLDASLADLARYRDRAVIIAADTALGPLVKAEIRPHLAVAADSSALNARHLTTVAGADAVMLVTEGSIHPSAMAAFGGRLFTFRVSDHEPWPWLASKGITRGELRTWGSVLTSAFDLARRMGCDPIVFAGADLAFTGGRPYCRGTIYDAMWQEWIDKGCTWQQMMDDYFSRQPEVWLDDVRGAAVRTAPHLVSFRNWLVEQMSMPGGPAYVNATGGGILHGGAIRQMTLGEVFGSLGVVPDVTADLRRRHSQATSNGADDRRLRDLLTSASAADLPMDRWQAFTASTVAPDRILAALPAFA